MQRYSTSLTGKTTSDLADLLDVNVWIALSAEDHVFHERARGYWIREAAEVIVFCRHTALGLVRITGQAHTKHGGHLTPKEAWHVYARWLAQPGVTLQPEPKGIDPVLERWVLDGLVTQRTWADAYLAAFALVDSHRIVTFDADLQRFPGPELLLLQ